MMMRNDWLGLQFFAEETAVRRKNGTEAGPGVETAAPGQSGEAAERPNAPQEEKERDGEKLPREESASAGKSALAALSRKDPALKQELESLIRKRVRSFAQARDSLKTLQPALELMASSYGQKTEKGLDYAALASAVQNDARYREAVKTPEAQTARFYAHVGKLMREAEALRDTFPDFDLRRELGDARFRRLIAPENGLSVKDAYYALHYDELRQTESALIAQRAERELANKIAAGRARPREGRGRASGTDGFARTGWSPAEIEQIKRKAMAARARGEKYYIG